MLNALRLRAGVATPLFLQRTGSTLAQLLERAAPALERDLLEISADRIKASDLGYAHLNTTLALLLD